MSTKGTCRSNESRSEFLNFHSLRSSLPFPRILVTGTPLPRLSLIFAFSRKMVMRGGNEPPSKKENQMNKLIFASLLSVGAILAAQAPAAPAPAASPKTTSKAKTSKKHHSKKTTAVNSTSANPPPSNFSNRR